MRQKNDKYLPPLLRQIPVEGHFPLCVSGLKDLEPHPVYEEGDDF